MVVHRGSLLGILLGSTLALAATGCGGIESGDYLLLRVAFADSEQNASCYVDGEIPKEIKDDTTSFRSGATLILYRGPTETYYLDTETTVMEGARKDDTFTFKGESVDVEYVNGQPAVLIHDSDHDGIDDNNDNEVDADKDGLDDQFQDDLVDTDNDGFDDRDEFSDDEVDVNGDGEDDRYTVVTPATDGDRYTSTNSTTVSFTISNNDITGSSEVSLKVTCEGLTCPTTLPDCTQNVKFVGTLVKDASVEHQL